MSKQTCNAKDCYATIPIYSRYCSKHEDTLATDIVIIDAQPTHNTCGSFDCCSEDCECGCFDCCSGDCECGCFDDD